MESPSPVPEPAPGEARCPSHPGQRVLGTCARCGTFFCELERETVNGRDYCATCAALPETDYLEAFRLAYWGKRDGWAWIIGLGGLLSLASGTMILTGEDWGGAEVTAGLVLLVYGAVGVCFWLGLPFARLAQCILAAVFALLAATTPGQIAGTLFPLAFSIAIYRDTRNKLFFKREVSREELRKAWHLYANNTVARWGLLLGVFGLIAVPLALPALACSVIGLRRVNPTANPPVGRKGQAIAGIVLGAVSLVGWGGVLVYGLLREFH